MRILLIFPTPRPHELGWKNNSHVECLSWQSECDGNPILGCKADQTEWKFVIWCIWLLQALGQCIIEPFWSVHLTESWGTEWKTDPSGLSCFLIQAQDGAETCITTGELTHVPGSIGSVNESQRPHNLMPHKSVN